MSDPGVQASIHKNSATTLPRISNFINSTRFQDVNLLGRLYPATQQLDVLHWALPGGEGAWEEWTFEDIVTQTFTQAKVGDSFGPTWTTHWFRLQFSIPDSWAGTEVRLHWVSNSEAAVWSEDGVILQGLSTGDTVQRRTEYTITSSHVAGTAPYTMYIEMAANKLFGAAEGDNTDPPDPNMFFTLSVAEIRQRDRTMYKLTRDLEVLYQLASQLVDANDQRGYQALYTANQMVNSITSGNDSEASLLADAYFAKGNGSRAHTLAAIGNCHIDSAWLWPYSETKRKVARSFSSQLKLMEDYPEFIFVASQAQQWAWCKQYFPELFERVKNKVATGQFIPVGGTWIEMDGNIPSGESFIRQFLHGQRFYQRELGVTCKEFWLPDTFGYSAQIPALMRHVGLKRFLTQKMSWSMVNKFPHHNFTWEGIDGSTVLAHFPPGDSYTLSLSVSEARYSESNMRDKGRVSTSAFLYGYGDGGGGPTQDQLERRRRLHDTDGCPKMVASTPDQLFSQLETEQHNMCRWVGELYLELHNGTYTTHADMKRLCRKAEFALRDAEFLLSQAVAVLGPAAAASLLQQCQAQLEPAWQKVLLNQFHDVLPGSGIQIVYEDARELYNEALTAALAVRDDAAKAIYGTEGEAVQVLVNTLQWPRTEVVEVSAGGAGKRQDTPKAGEQYALVSVPAMGSAVPEALTPSQNVTVVENAGVWVLDNGLIRAEVDTWGRVVSLRVAGDARDVFNASLGNRLVLYDDQPIYWDAWDVMDYHLETPRDLNTAESGLSVTPVSVIESGPLVVKLRWGVQVSSASSFSQDIVLAADTPYLTFDTAVTWGENRKVLKVVFDTAIHATNAFYDVQFGHLQRPTHMNTSWDSARYEVPGHKWAELNETGFGLAVLNESKYGWMGRGSSLSLSLLRSPKCPDDQADMGDHTFSYALLPHTGSLQQAEVVRRAYEFNNPLTILQAPVDKAAWSGLRVVGAGAVVHTVKPAEDGSGAMVLRLYECDSARSSVTLELEWPVERVQECDGLEAAGADVAFSVEGGLTSVPLSLTPFSIRALLVTLQQ